MIDVTSEKLILPTEIHEHVPERKGRRLNLSTPYRWMQRGINGIRLEWVMIGGTRYTSVEALNRFFHRLTIAKGGGQISEAAPVRAAKSAVAANAELAREGW